MGNHSSIHFQTYLLHSEVVESLESVYGSIDQLDAWVGLLSEDHIDNAIFGELLMSILEEQFINLRDGDRFFYLNDDFFSAEEKNEISNTNLHDVVMRNCALTIMQKNLFEAMPHNGIPNGPEIARLHLESIIYPNPVGESTTLKVYSESASDVSVRIMDYNGRMLMYVENQLT